MISAGNYLIIILTNPPIKLRDADHECILLSGDHPAVKYHQQAENTFTIKILILNNF